MSAPDLTKQADTLTDYLLHSPIDNPKIYDLYSIIVSNGSNTTEQKLINYAFKHPALLPFLDAGLVFVRPESELRRRLYVMFAILESMPEYADMFLPKRFGVLGILSAIGHGISAMLRALVGIIILKVARL